MWRKQKDGPRVGEMVLFDVTPSLIGEILSPARQTERGRLILLMKSIIVDFWLSSLTRSRCQDIDGEMETEIVR